MGLDPGTAMTRLQENADDRGARAPANGEATRALAKSYGVSVSTISRLAA